MASKMLPLILGGALAVSVSGMALAQSNAQNNKPLQPMTDETANSANKTQQPTGQNAAPANRMAPSTTTGSGAAKSGSTDLGKNPKGSAGADKPIQPMTDENKNSAEPKR